MPSTSSTYSWPATASWTASSNSPNHHRSNLPPDLDCLGEFTQLLTRAHSERASLREFIQEGAGLHAQELPSDLGDGPHRRAATEDRRDPDQAHGGYLDYCPVLKWRDQGDHAIQREVDCGYWLTGLEEHRLDVEER